MEFKVLRKGNENYNKYPTDDIKVAQRFANSLKKELNEFLIGVVVFGSSVRKETTHRSDIDVLVIIDDTTTVLTDSIIEGYRIIVENLMNKISTKLHVTSMTFTSYWEHVRNGDPILVNILRDGVALLDTGFFQPVQELLKQGRVRPSEESIWRYYGRAPRTLLNSRWHVLQATLDLYWGVIDAAHAALMRANQIPPNPNHVAEMLNKVFVKHKMLEKKYVETMRRFYKLSKMITHREIKEIKGHEYEKYYYEADEFIKRMRKLIQKKH